MIVVTASITCPGTSFTVEQLSALRRASGGFVAKRKQWLLDGDTCADELIRGFEPDSHNDTLWNVIQCTTLCSQNQIPPTVWAHCSSGEEAHKKTCRANPACPL